MAARSAPEGNKDTPTRTANRDNAEQATQARQSGQDAGHSRLAENVPSDQRVPEQVYADYAQNYDEDDAALERVMNLGENRIEMRIPRSAWVPRDLRFPHS
jgi:hypothetical protein